MTCFFAVLLKQQNCRQEYASILICESREAPV